MDFVGIKEMTQRLAIRVIEEKIEEEAKEGHFEVTINKIHINQFVISYFKSLGFYVVPSTTYDISSYKITWRAER